MKTRSNLSNLYAGLFSSVTNISGVVDKVCDPKSLYLVLSAQLKRFNVLTNNVNRLKTDPVTSAAHAFDTSATETRQNVCCICSNREMFGFVRRVRLFLGQCISVYFWDSVYLFMFGTVHICLFLGQCISVYFWDSVFLFIFGTVYICLFFGQCTYICLFLGQCIMYIG